MKPYKSTRNAQGGGIWEVDKKLENLVVLIKTVERYLDATSKRPGNNLEGIPRT